MFFFYILVGFYLLWEVQLAIQSGFIQHFLYKEKSVRKSRIWHLFSIGFIYLFLQFNFLWSSLFLLFNFLKGYQKYPFCVDFLHLANFGERNVRFRALSVYFQGYSKNMLALWDKILTQITIWASSFLWGMRWKHCNILRPLTSLLLQSVWYFLRTSFILIYYTCNLTDNCIFEFWRKNMPLCINLCLIHISWSKQS